MNLLRLSFAQPGSSAHFPSFWTLLCLRRWSLLWWARTARAATPTCLMYMARLAPRRESASGSGSLAHRMRQQTPKWSERGVGLAAIPTTIRIRVAPPLQRMPTTVAPGPPPPPPPPNRRNSSSNPRAATATSPRAKKATRCRALETEPRSTRWGSTQLRVGAFRIRGGHHDRGGRGGGWGGRGLQGHQEVEFCLYHGLWRGDGFVNGQASSVRIRKCLQRVRLLRESFHQCVGLEVWNPAEDSRAVPRHSPGGPWEANQVLRPSA